MNKSIIIGIIIVVIVIIGGVVGFTIYRNNQTESKFNIINNNEQIENERIENGNKKRQILCFKIKNGGKKFLFNV